MRAKLSVAAWRLLALTLLVGLAACDRGPSSFYPLEERLSWVYAATVEQQQSATSAQAQRGEAVITNLPRRALNGVDVTPQLYEVGDESSLVFAHEDENGVHVVAMKPPGAKKEVPVEKPMELIRYPAVVGAAWDDTAETMFLDEPITVAGQTRIASETEVVNVPAGRFTNCKELVFKGTAETRLPREFGAVTVDVETTSWLAPSVGIVKMVHKETYDRLTLRSGALTLELKAFKKI